LKKNLNLLIVFIFYLFLSISLSLSLSGKSDVQKMQTSSKKEDAASLTSGVKPAVDPALFQAMEYRLIGPYRGGRSPAVAGVPGNPFTYYMGTSGGGVWKTTDAGETWDNISDYFFKCSSIGAITVANSDPNIIYVGTGETNLRGDVQTGVGVYKSEDSGKTWRHIGLENSGQIGRIRIHPTNPDLVYVAALGHAFGPNQERGVYRSKDGGKNWEKVLFVSEKAGAVDLVMDVNNPRVLYAAIYQVIRKPWIFISGGEDSGLYKTTDGGDSWIKLANGLPQGVKGRIGVAVSSANSSRVWVNIEAEDGGVYRSDDGGKTFIHVNKERKLRTRPFYFTHIFADPIDENTVYVLNISFNKSIDGGKTFETIGLPHGDTHDLWINPDNPQIMINGNDGGATISFNGGKSWSTQMNQPTAEFYRVTTDNQFLYRVYGAQQDSSTVSISSRTTEDGIGIQDWYEVGGGEQGHIWVDPRNPNIVYAGVYYNVITRYDRQTGQLRNIEAYPELGEGQAAEAMRFRFQMNAPIRISPHDPNILYHCSQFVHKSTNEGQSWKVISSDLTRNDKSKQKPSGGPITLDHTGPEIYNTIFAFEESPHVPGLLWAGTDDGLVHLSRNGGMTWENITPKGMPERGTINMIELSPHEAGRTFIAVHCYRLDDFKPYIFRTDDYGQTWSLLTNDNGILSNHFVRAIREDPDRKGLLYAGTEFGMYISFNDGKSWQPFQLNLPVVQVADIVVKNKDLVVATHGRSFWILDDLTPLHQINDEVAKAKSFLFKPGLTYRVPGSTRETPRLGKNPPNGARIYYYLAEAPAQEVKLEFLDSAGSLIQSFSNKEKEGKTLSTKAGLNRFVWDLRYPEADVVKGTIFFGMNIGPKVVPGNYQVRMSVGDWSQTQSFEVRKDPRLSTTQEDFQAQYDLAIKVRDKITEAHKAIKKIRDVRSQVENLSLRLEKGGGAEDIISSGKKLNQKLTSIEEKLIQTKNETRLDTCNFPPQLDNQFIRLTNVILSADARPTEGSYERFEDLKAELAVYSSQLQEVFEKDLAALNSLVRNKNIPPVLVPIEGKTK
jgi:photosystem II stability/assembly factor-like uncharacterized protein